MMSTYSSGEPAKGVTAFIGMGSNIGDREHYLREAKRLLSAHPFIRLIAASPIYETEPVGLTEQGYFLNQVLRVDTEMTPQDLLGELLRAEQELGRTRDIRWGPRTLDLDLLLYGNSRIEGKELEVPHPRMWERAFVLVPLADVTGVDDPFYASVKMHLGKLGGKEGVVLWTNDC